MFRCTISMHLKQLVVLFGVHASVMLDEETSSIPGTIPLLELLLKCQHLLLCIFIVEKPIYGIEDIGGCSPFLVEADGFTSSKNAISTGTRLPSSFAEKYPRVLRDWPLSTFGNRRSFFSERRGSILLRENPSFSINSSNPPP